ncbi:hypothetical protein PN499_10640 [Kamptonema animale CS-326]|uniref:hypothetical protein n=1 Tax=Kamptonema animale TaxID=92934 RepID=UPI0023311B7D|nr:hypothetical protein [Kamptonema animale]MDB9511640.1 hypothetical protein [Kamptonema animale CS-326]
MSLLLSDQSQQRDRAFTRTVLTPYSQDKVRLSSFYQKNSPPSPITRSPPTRSLGIKLKIEIA